MVRPIMRKLGSKALNCVTDPRYEEEVSGCTASVGILTHDKIYVVCYDLPASGQGRAD